MTIAVTGAKGRLGSYLTTAGCIRLRCDVSRPDQIAKALEEMTESETETGIEAIINCAAWTDVDAAEDEGNYDRVMAVNLRGAANLRKAYDGLLVHISTGFVFNGTDGPNRESDTLEPVNVYGWSKFGGEQAAQMREPTLIVRTLDLFGSIEKPDFVRQIRDILELGADKSLPDNLYGTPTYIPHLAQALLQAIGREMTGVIHIAGDLTLSRFEWGQRIAEVFDLDPDLIKPTSEIAGVAPRPLRGGLNVDKAEGLGLPIYSPIDGLTSLQQLESELGDET